MPVAFAATKNHEKHRASRHVERPERLHAVLELIEDAPLRDDLHAVDVKSVSPDILRLVHEERHVAEVSEAVRKGFDRLDADTYITADSFEAALESVGCLLAVTESVVHGEIPTGFAAVRPPGHHATAKRSMGFCLFSNAAIAARWAQRELGVGRVLIVDIDVHHGNGTQDIFYDDPSVMYVSMHQSPFYPGTGAAHERGTGEAIGTTINVPLPKGTGDEGYMEALTSVMRPLTLDYDPDLVVLSAGYDAHWKDVLGGMHVTTRGFAEMVREIGSWAATCCGGRLVATLEGGYHLEALGRSVLATLQVLNDPKSDVEDPLGASPEENTKVDEYLKDVETYLRA